MHLGVDELREAVGQGVDAVAQFENAWAGVAEASGEGRRRQRLRRLWRISFWKMEEPGKMEIGFW